MDKVVQQAAATSEESASAAQEIAGQSQLLSATVGRFHLDDGEPLAEGDTPLALREPG